MTRAYIGRYPCSVCARLVRVYDWLPECVLCAPCARKEDRNERQGEEREEQVESEEEICFTSSMSFDEVIAKLRALQFELESLSFRRGSFVATVTRMRKRRKICLGVEGRGPSVEAALESCVREWATWRAGAD